MYTRTITEHGITVPSVLAAKLHMYDIGAYLRPINNKNICLLVLNSSNKTSKFISPYSDGRMVISRNHLKYALGREVSVGEKIDFEMNGKTGLKILVGPSPVQENKPAVWQTSQPKIKEEKVQRNEYAQLTFPLRIINHSYTEGNVAVDFAERLKCLIPMLKWCWHTNNMDLILLLEGNEPININNESIPCHELP